MKNYIEEIMKDSELLRNIHEIWNSCRFYSVNIEDFYNNFCQEASKNPYFNNFNFSHPEYSTFMIRPKEMLSTSSALLNDIIFDLIPYKNSTAYSCIKEINLLKKIDYNLNASFKFGGETGNYHYNQISFHNLNNCVIDFIFHSELDSDILEFYVDKSSFNLAIENNHDKHLEFYNFLNLVHAFAIKPDQLIFNKLKKSLFESHIIPEEELDLLTISNDIDLKLLNNVQYFFIDLENFNIDKSFKKEKKGPRIKNKNE